MSPLMLAEVPKVVTPQNLNGVVEMVDNIDQKHDAAHERLRADFRQMEVRVESNYGYFRERFEALTSRVDRNIAAIDDLKTAPVNIDKLLFSPRLVMTIAGSVFFTVGSICGVFWGTTSGLRSDYAELKSALALKQVQDDARWKLQDERDQTRQTEIIELRRQMQLTQMQVQEILKSLQTKGKK